MKFTGVIVDHAAFLVPGQHVEIGVQRRTLTVLMNCIHQHIQAQQVLEGIQPQDFRSGLALFNEQLNRSGCQGERTGAIQLANFGNWANFALDQGGEGFKCEVFIAALNLSVKPVDLRSNTSGLSELMGLPFFLLLWKITAYL
ncbi:hypothetical protein DV532_29615 (plasmid) [Pseudomonas sp. Leaf58]|uniref:hypothetical protein n=1 Tax=Pseudomonas sp. Leaf58 TaxID=1736226 RepID=UPI000EA99647|nr:hypothetical protein [Pseudomonas sp. Leaf58]AYG48397.1 hypothetical protein DV532_29615 [Pseudomonas sp. Leaf58]